MHACGGRISVHACGGRIRVLYALAMTVRVGMVEVRSKAYYCRLMASTPAAVGLGATVLFHNSNGCADAACAESSPCRQECNGP